MANNTSNVRFYKLPVLPSFDAAKHTGIFVHVTETMLKNPWKPTGKEEAIDPTNIFMTPFVEGQEEGRLNLVQWLAARRISQVESGLWFGGENGWELLSNEISGGFAENGELQINTNSVFTANQAGNSNITLDANALSFNSETNTISVVANTDVSSTNKLATMADIAGIAGAMHYRGPLTGAASGDGSWPSTVAAGDVYIVTTAFTHSSDALEVGDMIVFNSNSTSDYKVVQSNLTLGVGQGQVAANTEALTSGNLVVASATGIETTNYNINTASNRTLSVGNTATTTGDTSIIHETKATDTLTILGQDRVSSLTINSTNDSISVSGSNTNNDGTVTLDLVWNTVLA
jgi:hypothetical protein